MEKLMTPQQFLESAERKKQFSWDKHIEAAKQKCAGSTDILRDEELYVVLFQDVQPYGGRTWKIYKSLDDSKADRDFSQYSVPRDTPMDDLPNILREILKNSPHTIHIDDTRAGNIMKALEQLAGENDYVAMDIVKYIMLGGKIIVGSEVATKPLEDLFEK